jgi:hypothetical protein
MDKKGEERLLGQLPGTGGDFLDTDDTEGHRRTLQVDGDQPVIRRDDEPGTRFPDVEGDVEGHRAYRKEEEDGLYRGGPTTQGEIVMRGPNDNPHGDR